MTEFIIKRVGDETFPDFLFLLEQLAEYEHLDPPDAGARVRLKADIAGNPPKFEGYLGISGDEPVGYVTFYFTYSTFLARSTLFLEDIFVLGRHRGNGFGKRLLEFCRDEALARGCGRIDWMVLAWNDPAVRFYESIGATRLGWHVYRLEL
ncbi:MAG TPA: GNAT family N-acetyltransferase [Methanoregulaceae archaeon]|nr:GNAT family N-acetyltransferase [Methanoregulaceae archaeon]